MTDTNLELQYRGVVRLLCEKHNKLLREFRMQGLTIPDDDIETMQMVAEDFNSRSTFTEMTVSDSGDCAIFPKEDSSGEDA